MKMRKERKTMDYMVFNIEKLDKKSAESLKEELESHRMNCRNTEKDGIMRVYIPRKIAEKVTLEVFTRMVVKSSDAACKISYKDRKVYADVIPRELLGKIEEREAKENETEENNLVI